MKLIVVGDTSLIAVCVSAASDSAQSVSRCRRRYSSPSVVSVTGCFRRTRLSTLRCRVAMPVANFSGCKPMMVCARYSVADACPCHGNHKIACREGCAERKLRRAIRRLQEARNHQLPGRQVPQELRNAIRRSALARDEQQAALQQFGNALRRVSDRLEVLLQTKHRQALQKWRDPIHATSGACRWLKREEATPLLVTDED